ncbi:unnamed protein product [Heterobilharzia americana]|nr:unnamed protein product [Heterobilharzia americana]
MFYSGHHLVSCDGKKRNLNIDIDLSTSSDLKKELEFRLTDCDDFYFLFSARITVDEFSKIKHQQGLLVNFNDFEQRVVDLLHTCSQEEYKEAPKYGLRFSKTPGEGCGLLQIVEATNFKYLHHLSLNLGAADDEKLKAYLVSCLKKLKTESDIRIKQLSQSVSEITSCLRSVEEAKRSIMDDFESFKVQYSAREADLRTKYENTIQEMGLQHEEIKTKLEESVSKEKDLFQQMQEELHRDFKSRLDLALSNNKNLRDNQSTLQIRVEQLQDKLKLSETENISLNEEVKGLRAQLDTAHRTNSDQSEIVNQLQSRLSTLEQDLAVKNKQLLESKNLLTTEQEQKSHTLEQLEHQCHNVQNLEKMLSSNLEEINKSNEIIKRLQTDVKSYQVKAKLRGQVAAEQERLLITKDSEIQRLNAELNSLKSELVSVTRCNAHITEEHRQAMQSLMDAQKTIKSNETIIAWLNRQIAENDLGYVQNRLKLSIPPVTNESNSLTNSPPLTSTNVLVISRNEKSPPRKSTLLSQIPVMPCSKTAHLAASSSVCTSSTVVFTTPSTNTLSPLGKKLSILTTNSNLYPHFKNLVSRTDYKNPSSEIPGLHCTTNTLNYRNPKENGDLFDSFPISVPLKPANGPATQPINCNDKVQEMFDSGNACQYPSPVTCTNDENCQQQSLASAYFPQAFP